LTKSAGRVFSISSKRSNECCIETEGGRKKEGKKEVRVRGNHRLALTSAKEKGGNEFTRRGKISRSSQAEKGKKKYFGDISLRTTGRNMSGRTLLHQSGEKGPSLFFPHRTGSVQRWDKKGMEKKEKNTAQGERGVRPGEVEKNTVWL